MTKEKLSQAYYSSDTIYFTINNESQANILDDIYEQLNNVVLLKELSSDGLVRGVVFDTDPKPPGMLQGQFFTEEDFFTNKQLATIGKNYIDNIEKKGNSDYIILFDTQYEVIGILGEKTESVLDYMILINLDSVEEQDIGLYAIDGKRKSDIEDSYNAICKILDSNAIKHGRIVREAVGIKRLLEYEKSNVLIFTLIYIIILLSGLSVTVSWYEKNKKLIYVKKLVGYKNRHIISDIIKRYTMLFHIAYVAALIAYVMLNISSISDIGIFLYYLYSYLLILVFSLFIVVAPFIKSQNQNVVTLRQRWKL